MGCCCCGKERTICSKEEKDALIDKVIEIEKKMFVAVEAAEPADCQQMLKTFHAMRYMSFAVLSFDTIHSYWEDLQFALKENRNLVKEKYARMDNLIPVFHESEFIEKIVALESKWMKELAAKYPLIIKFDQHFVNYEHSELETYSDQTLELYWGDLETADQMKVNMCEERYKILYKGMGFNSLEEVEEKAKQSAAKREA